MSLKSKKKTIIAKIETTYGTDSAPTGSANAMLVGNLNITPLNATTVARNNIFPYFGNNQTLLAETSVSVDFEIEFAGSGSAGVAPHWAPLLVACGFSETVVATTSVTYAPISTALQSLTIWVNIDGVMHKITGCRGTYELTMAAKGIPVIKFTFTGIFNAPADIAAPTCDFSAFITPKVVNTANTPSFSLFTYSGHLESMSLVGANDIQYRTLVGYEAVDMIDRKPSGKFVLEAPTITAKDFFSIAKAGTLGAMSITHGTVAGNIITAAAPSVSLQNPAYSDSQGVVMLTIPFTAVPVVGNDELSFVFT